MKKIITYSLAVLGGIILGITIMGYLSARASKIYLEALRISIVAEQNQLAAKAHKREDRFSELVHRSNVVTFSAPGRLDSLEGMKQTWTFSFPFASLVLEKIGQGSEKGKLAAHCVDLARLAEAMEGVGLTKEAVQVWQDAAKPLGYSDIEKLKVFVASLHKVDADAGIDKNK